MGTKLFFTLFKIIFETFRYQRCLLDYLIFHRRYSESTFYANDRHARVHCYSIYLMVKFITEPFYTKQKHYRSDSFLEDMKANLKNVAIPGTGIPLSYFVSFRPFLYFFILIFTPLVCFCGAINQTYQDFTSDVEDSPDSGEAPPTSSSLSWQENLFHHYYVNLLTSKNWFSLWRHNSHLVTYHAYLTHSLDYDMEDKWKFLKVGKDMKVPISPFFDDIETIVCKNILIEGGMGIHFYKNAIFGGNYIIQEKLKNALWLNQLLPKNAPLSTMRIITTSTYALSKDYSQAAIKRLLRQEEELEESFVSDTIPSGSDNMEDDGWRMGAESRDDLYPPVSPQKSSPNRRVGASTPTFHYQNMSTEEQEEVQQFIRAETAVLRLGRMNAATDHSSILFNVNLESGVIEPGQINSQWYQLGLDKIWTTSWLPAQSNIRHHLDPPYPEVAGTRVPDMSEAVRIVTSTHYKMMPEVPIVGWDVAFTTKGIFLLEVNLSCNFFCGKFDLARYVAFLHDYWLHLEKLEATITTAEGSATAFPENGNDATKKYKRRSFKEDSTSEPKKFH